MEPTPTANSPRIPSGQQEAQDTVVRYLQNTIDAMPKGTTADGSRYAIGDGTNYCDNNPDDTNSPVQVSDIRDLRFPPGTDYFAVIDQTGKLWGQWGWKVLERDGFSKPNRFGYAPDGYVLQIESRPDPTQVPSLTGTSPCFAGDLRSDNIVKELILRQRSGH